MWLNASVAMKKPKKIVAAATSVNTAVRELRKHLDLSQQEFANRLNLSMRAVANYEKNRQPGPKSLIILEQAALDAGRHDLREIFGERLMKEFRASPLEKDHQKARRLWESAMGTSESVLVAEITGIVFRQNDNTWLQHELEKVIEKRKHVLDSLRKFASEFDPSLQDEFLRATTHQIQRYEDLLAKLKDVNHCPRVPQTDQPSSRE
jgi:transcriptional regulator with XRE-family HTH domain